MTDSFEPKEDRPAGEPENPWAWPSNAESGLPSTEPPVWRLADPAGEVTVELPTEPPVVAPPASPVEAPAQPVAAPPQPVVEPVQPVAAQPAWAPAPPVTAPAPPPAPAVTAPTPAPPTDSIFRPSNPTQPIPPIAEPTIAEPLATEQARLAAERAARRDATTAAIASPAPAPVALPAPVVIHKRTNDRFWGALGLFLLRLVVAAIFVVRGTAILVDIPAATAMFAKTVIPEPGLMAIITGVASLLIALSMILGLLTRVSGFGVALIAGGALAFVYWGPWSPFVPGQPGFLGELELLLATVGLLFVFVGAGGWSLDRSFRAGREADKAERAQRTD